MTEHTKLPWHVEGMTLCVVSDHAPKGRMRVADIRGWGYLTGKGDGALGLTEDDAFAIQEANAALIVNAVNNHEALVRALTELHAMVGGECPSLLNEDSGGNARLDIAIRDILSRVGGARE